ncbi:MAG: hypothetical protein R3D83_09920 [Caenibius sp.]|jgi:hypothetical protein
MGSIAIAMRGSMSHDWYHVNWGMVAAFDAEGRTAARHQTHGARGFAMLPAHLRRNDDALKVIREIVESGNDGPVLMMNLNRYTQEAAVGARILWCTPVFGQAVGTQHIDEILAVWYPTHKTFLDLSDAPGAKESYRLRGACVAYAVIHRCSGSNSPLDGNG